MRLPFTGDKNHAVGLNMNAVQVKLFERAKPIVYLGMLSNKSFANCNSYSLLSLTQAIAETTTANSACA